MLCKLATKDNMICIYENRTDRLIERLLHAEARHLVTSEEIEWLDDGLKLVKHLCLGGKENE